MNLLDLKRVNVSEMTRGMEPDLFHNLFIQQAEKYEQNPYIITEDQTLTYGEVRTAVKRLAVSLSKLNLNYKLGNVALIFPNYSELVISKLSTSLLGLVAVPLNYRLTTSEMGYLIRQSDSTCIIMIDKWRSADYIAMLKELCPEVFEGKTSNQFPYLKKIIVFSPEGHKYEGTYDLYDLINKPTDEEVEATFPELKAFKEISVTDTSDIMYTSGTTSLPKGVLITHDMVWRAALGSCINRGYQEGRKIYVPLPLYHCFGYIVGLVGATLVGGSVILQDDFEEYKAMELIRRFKADDMLCVPTIAIRLLRVFKMQNEPLNLDAMYCAGAEVPISLWEELKNTLGIKELITGYGMTELAGGVLQTDPEDELLFLTQFVGRTIPGGHVGPSDLNGFNIEFKIRDIELRHFLPFGKEGELVCRGPIVTKGYYNKELETSEAIKDGWLSTGDLGIMYENGYISLTGRLKEIYRIGAENVAPKEIEEVFTSHAGVNQAYVIGIPDQVLGEIGMAWVVLEPGEKVTEQDLLAFVSSKLARFKVPKYIKIVEESELPRTATGKIQKFKLKELALI